MAETRTELDKLANLPFSERILPLAQLGRRLLQTQVNGAAGPLREQILDVLKSGVGKGRDRVELGEILGVIGDPRLFTTDQSEYWIGIDTPEGKVEVGRYPVTNAEFHAFAEKGYEQREHWSDEGWAWLAATEDPWPVHAARETWRNFVVANQPVVGISWYEAEAYANSVGARLPRVDERVWVVRGAERRPYPWGAPFGEGNANTREEVLGRPCAVGLYTRDQTPEGVSDLAGNVGEWTADSREVSPDEAVGRPNEAGEHIEFFIHPGSWNEPSMAAWAKALSMAPPSARWTGLGCRLVR